MRSIKPPVPHSHGEKTSYIPSNLGMSKYVYVRTDSRKNPLQRPYDGRYLIINQSDKYFTLNIKGREEIVSIDHLKTAFNTDLTGCKNNNLVTSAESCDLSDKACHRDFLQRSDRRQLQLQLSYTRGQDSTSTHKIPSVTRPIFNRSYS